MSLPGYLLAWARLPGPARLLAELAAALFRDPHALDRSTPLGRACVRSLELRRAVAEGGSYRDPLEDVQLWSAAWAGAGVICDAVSAQVLVLNLPLAGNAPAVRLCHAAPGGTGVVDHAVVPGRLGAGRGCGGFRL